MYTLTYYNVYTVNNNTNYMDRDIINVLLKCIYKHRIQFIII